MVTVTMVEPVLFLSFLLAFGTCVMFDIGIQHVCIHDISPLATLYRLSFISCAQKCNCLPGCEYVNYNHMLNSCQIYTTPVNVSDRTCYDATLLTKEDAEALVPQTIRRACEENETKYCSDSELESANADIYGNVNTIGAKRVKVCHKNYQMQGESRGTTVCTAQANGRAKWSDLGVCESTVVNFDPPSPTANIDVTSVQVVTSNGVVSESTVVKCDKPLVTDNINVTSVQVITSNGVVKNYTRLEEVDVPLLDNSTISMRCSLEGTEFGKDMITCKGGRWTEDKPCAGALHRPCGNDETCNSKVPGSECRGGQCWCKSGRSFDPSTSTCVTDCSGEYGTTFQIVQNRQIVNAVLIDQQGLPSIANCMNFCLKKNNCFRANRKPHPDYGNPMCYVYGSLASTVEIQFENNTDSTFLQRDCARGNA